MTKTHLKWTIAKVNEGYSSPVVSGDYLYRLQNPELLKCYHLSTGEEVYSERLNGVSTASSPIATADGLHLPGQRRQELRCEGWAEVGVAGDERSRRCQPGLARGRGWPAVPQGPQVALLHRNEELT